MMVRDLVWVNNGWRDCAEVGHYSIERRVVDGRYAIYENTRWGSKVLVHLIEDALELQCWLASLSQGHHHETV